MRIVSILLTIYFIYDLFRSLASSSCGPAPPDSIFFDKVGDLVPLVYANFVRKFEASPSVAIFFHMRLLPTPSIPESQRYIISRPSIPSCYRVTVLYGYMDDVITADLAKLLVDQITLFITSDLAVANGSGPFNHSKDIGVANRVRDIRAELASLQHAEY